LYNVTKYALIIYSYELYVTSFQRPLGHSVGKAITITMLESSVKLLQKLLQVFAKEDYFLKVGEFIYSCCPGPLLLHVSATQFSNL